MSSSVRFVSGARKLMLLKLDGEANFGIHEEQHASAHGHRVFLVRKVDRLSPSDRAGIARGDQLLNVKVVGVDGHAYTWSDAALERIERLHEIHVVEIYVKKPPGIRLSDTQLRHRDHISEWLTKAKALSISSTRLRGAFIPSQLKRVVVLLYDFEHDYFADMWKALPDQDRVGITLPVARAFVSETKLPGLLDDAARPTATPMPSLPTTPVATPPLSPARTDADATVSQVDSLSSDIGHTESEDAPSSSPAEANGSNETDADNEPEQPPASPRQRLKLMTARTAAAIGHEETLTRRRRLRKMFAAKADDSDSNDPHDVVCIKTESVRANAAAAPVTVGDSAAARAD